jgi:hypothetical protein
VTSDELRDVVATAMMKQQAAKQQYGFGPFAKGMQGLGEGLRDRFAPVAPQQPGPPVSLAPPPQQQQMPPQQMAPPQQQQMPLPQQQMAPSPTEPWMPPASWEN